MKISIVFVHYNAQLLLEESIRSILDSDSELELEFLICDNSLNFEISTSIKLIKKLQVSNLGFNSGFSRGVNNGLKQATGDYILILNQDAKFTHKNTLLSLAKQAQNQNAKTIFGCQLYDEKQEKQQSIWLDNPFLMREWRSGPIFIKCRPNWKKEFTKKTDEIHTHEGFVPRINGAFLFFKRPDKIEDLLFDEDFFLYGEDIEWALRIKKIGYRFYHLPAISALHLGSSSTENIWLRTFQIIISDWLVVKKRKGNLYLIALYLLILVNQVLNLFLMRFANFRGKEIKSDTQMYTKRFSKLYFYALKKYAFQILMKRHFYKNNEFILNAYKNDKLFSEQIRDIR